MWILGLLLLWMCTGCIQTKLNNAEQLMNRSDFAAAAIAAPEWTRAALRVINELEEQLEARP